MKILSALLAFTFLAGAPIGAIPAQTRPSSIKIVPANVFDELQKKLAAEPKIKPAELARYANGLLAKKGLDFQFDLCEFVQRNNPTPRGRAAQAKVRTYKLPMKQTDGRQVTFETRLSEEEGNGMCGECFFSIPAAKVTKQEIELVTGGKKYLLVRPPSFHLDEMSLVDQSMRKVLRTWQVPDQGEPLGVSSDGTKVYLETAIESLILEISESSSMRILAREEVTLPKGETVQKHPTDPKNAYLSFMRFRFGGRSLVIRFSEPCT
jgi:hypothetical protein